MTINTREELIDHLHTEMRVTEDAIGGMEEMIDTMQMDIAFAKGRNCGVCCILSQIEDDDE